MLESVRPQFLKILLCTVAAFVCVLILALTLPAWSRMAPGGDDGAAYRASVEKWRQDYEADLRSDHGWLTISGLFWLHEGDNKFGSDPLNDIVLPESSSPPEAGTFELRDGKVIAHIK